MVAGRNNELEELLARGDSALAADGDLHAARRHFEAAYRVAEKLGDGRGMALAALGMGGIWVHEQRTVAGVTLLRSRLRQALSHVDSRSPLGLRLRARLTAENDYRHGDYAAILAVLDEARRVRDPLALAETLSLAHHCLLGPDHGALRQSIALDLVGESSRTGRNSDLLLGVLWQTVNLFFEGDSHAHRRLVELRELLSQTDHLAVGYVASAIDVMLAIRAGRLEEAETLANACASTGAAAGDVDATGWYGAHLVAIRWYQGRLAELLPLLEDVAHSPTLSAVDNSFFAALAVSAAAAGDTRKAASALATLRGRSLSDLPRSSSWLVALAGIVEAAALLGDAQISAEAYELLAPYAHLPVMASLAVACFGSAQYVLGVASITTGDLDRAVEHLRLAIQDNLALAHWPAVVTSRLRYAEALLARGRAEDAAVAQQQQDIARSEAAALGIAAVVTAAPDPAGSTVELTREGQQWRVGLGRRSVTVEHSVGMFHLAVLLANPGQEIHAVDLVSGLAVLGHAGQGTGLSEQPKLDRVAAREYRERLSQLRIEIDELDSRDESDRAQRARAERDWLLAELAGAAGIGGRTRAFADGGERARIAVGKAVRRALQRIGESDPVIGDHLKRTVHTGMRSCYRPT